MCFLAFVSCVVSSSDGRSGIRENKFTTHTLANSVEQGNCGGEKEEVKNGFLGFGIPIVSRAAC